MKLAASVRALFHRLPDDPRARGLHARLLPLRPTRPARGDAGIVVQCVEDPFYLGLFTRLCHALRARAEPAIDLYVPRSVNARVGAGWKTMLMRSFPLGRLVANQWVRLYDVVTDRVGYRSTSLRHPLGDAIDAWRSWRIWKAARSVAQLEALQVDGVTCGDLVLDTYLRFRPSPRIRLDDPFLFYLLWQAHRDVRRARRYFGSVRPRLYLASYTTYVQHGIAARVALQEGTRVVCFGNFQQFGKELSLDDTFHTRDAVRYRRDFDAVPNRDALMEEARRQLELRLSGGIDSATFYMASSAYRTTTAEVPDASGAVVVFLHDFYDSPHIYADLVFPDFWEWTCCTIETLRAASIKFLVKPHPNQIALSDSVIGELKQRFPDMQLIPSGVTNRQLVDAGMACAVTVYGTIAHEMAYLGVPSIACARHPHVAFDFCRTATDRDGYVKLLRQALQLSGDPKVLREQALQFYVMHNLNLPREQIALRDAMLAAWRESHDTEASADAIAQAFERLAALPGFDSFVQGLLGAPSGAAALPGSEPTWSTP
ncbi:hypothetical protein [Piscinibacter sp. XHJ-5]|uniref:hypothetical protein n=1 Tax=Piscinibacter sp. XHJ-5 TaxID=3037797 RepID=UPI0024528503|nr:hypothetical protein [Piscinibacter sp. XHJ-5]